MLFKILTVVKTQLQVQVDELLTTMSSKTVEGIRYFYKLLYVMQKHSVLIFLGELASISLFKQ